MEYGNLLSEIGLSNWESQTYLALLELGSTTTGPLIQKSEVPSSKIYGILESLIKKGLVNYIIKGKTKYFQATDPERILILFKEKESKIKSMLSELKLKQSKEKQSVELYEGVKAIRSMLLGLIQDIKKGENWYGFSTGETSTNKEIEEFYEWWGARKRISNLKDNLLISFENKEEFESKIEKSSLKKIKKILRYSKVSFPGDVAIFRNQVVIFNWEEVPTATLIINNNLAKQYRDFFLGLWRIAKK